MQFFVNMFPCTFVWREIWIVSFCFFCEVFCCVFSAVRVFCVSGSVLSVPWFSVLFSLFYRASFTTRQSYAFFSVYCVESATFVQYLHSHYNHHFFVRRFYFNNKTAIPIRPHIHSFTQQHNYWTTTINHRENKWRLDSVSTTSDRFVFFFGGFVVSDVSDVTRFWDRRIPPTKGRFGTEHPSIPKGPFWDRAPVHNKRTVFYAR